MATLDLATRWIGLTPHLLSLLRIIAALMFMEIGAMKLFAWPVGMPPDDSIAEPWTQVWIAGVLEVFGGALLLVGLFTRPVAFTLAGMMAVAYWQFHHPMSPWITVNNGAAAVLYCFVFLFLSAAGPGRWSLDALLRRRRIYRMYPNSASSTRMAADAIVNDLTAALPTPSAPPVVRNPT